MFFDELISNKTHGQGDKGRERRAKKTEEEKKIPKGSRKGKKMNRIRDENRRKKTSK